MSEALIGVLIGGAIASIAPLATLIAQHRRWKWEAKLEYLRTERRRLEDLYSDTLNRLKKGMAENSYPSEMISDILMLMPKPIAVRFDSWMDEKNKDATKAKNVYMSICAEPYTL
jgi:gas vesicle protein